MTRTYDRNELTWDLDELLALVEAGQAKAFPTPKGTHYVVKTDSGSFGVRPDQVFTATVKDLLPDPDDLSYLRSVIADPDAGRRQHHINARLVEDLFTARHGIAENRDGEFSEEEEELRDRLDQAWAQDRGYQELVEDINREIAALKADRDEAKVSAYEAKLAAEDALLAKFGA